MVDSTIRSRRFDKIYDFFGNLWMLSASPRKFWCRDLLCAEMEGARERAREKERHRGENGECFGSPVAVLLKI
jgi:hypothetical protein